MSKRYYRPSTSLTAFNTIPIVCCPGRGGIVQQTFIPHAERRTGYKCLDVMPLIEQRRNNENDPDINDHNFYNWMR